MRGVYDLTDGLRADVAQHFAIIQIMERIKGASPFSSTCIKLNTYKQPGYTRLPPQYVDPFEKVVVVDDLRRVIPHGARAVIDIERKKMKCLQRLRKTSKSLRLSCSLTKHSTSWHFHLG